MTRIQKAAVIGHPIGHTMSPFLQRRLFQLQNAPMAYQVLDLPELEPNLDTLRGLDCFNVTIPHKTAILSFLDGLDEKAAACGSVNTVRVKDGKFYGTTTDGAGCFKALERHGLDFSGETLLLGNGGASRAIAFEVAQRQKDFRLTIACREGSYSKAQALCCELADFARGHGDRDFLLVAKKYDELELETQKRYDLLLNATSVGMHPHAGASPVSKNVVGRCGAVFDAVYNPRETELLRIARQAGVQTVGGMEMLVYQAVESHRFWYGWSFREEDISQLCLDAEQELEKLFGEGGKKA